jgi:outer membrane receptor protein involved in Fe transport
MHTTVRRAAPAASRADAQRPQRLRALLCSGAAALALGAAGAPALAQDEEAASGSTERITVTGTRIIRTGMVTPTPVTAVGTEELENMSSTTILESLSELPTFFANATPEAANGGQNSGGSNLNLRGAGANRTLVLLDGRRTVSSNRFGTVDVAMFPQELIRSIETVTGGASASYGTDAVAGVVNFLLDTSYEGFKAHGQYGATRYGDGDNFEVGAAYGAQIGERGHLLASLEHYNLDSISSIESLRARTFYKQRARVTNPGGPDLILPYVVPTNWNNTGMITGPANTPLFRLVFNPDGTTSPFQFTGVGAVGGGCNCMALPSRTLGVDSDDEVAAGNKRTSAFVYYEHELGDNLKVYGQLLAGANEVSDRRENISFILTWAPRVFADNAYLTPDVAALINQYGTVVPGSDGVPSVPYQLFGINNGESTLQDVRQLTINELKSGTVGFEYEFANAGLLDGWIARGYFTHGENDQYFDTDNGIRVDRIPLAFDAVRDPATGNIVCHVALVDPTNFGDCVPMNIFGGIDNLSPQAVAYIVDDYKRAAQHIEQESAEFVVSGDIWEGFGAGPVTGAFGASYRREALDQSTPDPTDEFPATPDGVLLSDLGLLPPGIRGLVPQNGATGPDGPIPGIPGVRNVSAGFTGDANSSSVTFSSLRAISGESDVKEAFGEINLPLLSGLPFVDQLDVNGAARWADYSGSGEIWAWKVGASWQVVDDLRLRATTSRDVRAPNLREKFDQTRGGVNVSNPWRGGSVESTASLSGGNEALAPETADTMTIGAVIQPSFVDNLSVSLDWYNIEISDAINQLGGQTVVNRCFAGDADLCQFVLRDANDFIIRVDNLFFNLDTQIVEGVDLEATYGLGDFDFRLFASHVMENSIENSAGVIDERVGDMSLGFPEWKASLMINYSRDRLSAFVQERYIHEGKIDRNGIETSVLIPVAPPRFLVNDNTVPATFYTDIGARYRLGENEQVEIYGNVDNVFDQEPRATPGVVGRAGVNEFNQNLYDVLGRRYTVGVRVTF